MARKLSPGVHTIRIKKPGGGTRAQRVNVLKSGKFKFIKNVKGGAKSPKKAAAKSRGKTRGTSPGRRNPRMAKRKSSLMNRVANALLLLLAFSQPIRIAMGPGAAVTKVGTIVRQATFGLVRTQGGASKFDVNEGLQFYGPVVASFALFEVKKMAMKKFRF